MLESLFVRRTVALYRTHETVASRSKLVHQGHQPQCQGPLELAATAGAVQLTAEAPKLPVLVLQARIIVQSSAHGFFVC